jgi:hypothetical protein
MPPSSFFLCLGLFLLLAVTPLPRTTAPTPPDADARAAIELMTDAAQLSSPTPSRPNSRQKARYAFDDDKRFIYRIIPFTIPGLQLGEMRPGQIALFHTMLNAALSASGHRKAASIIALEEILVAIESESRPRQPRPRRRPLQRRPLRRPRSRRNMVLARPRPPPLPCLHRRRRPLLRLRPRLPRRPAPPRPRGPARRLARPGRRGGPRPRPHERHDARRTRRRHARRGPARAISTAAAIPNSAPRARPAASPTPPSRHVRA